MSSILDHYRAANDGKSPTLDKFYRGNACFFFNGMQKDDIWLHQNQNCGIGFH